MTDPRFLRLRELFDQALELDATEQEAFADRACAADPALRDQLGRLLRRQREKRTLSDSPVLPQLDAALREALPEAFVEGRMVGPFRIIEVIGDGGMGRVYRAVRDDGEIQQEVAIKLVRGELLNPALLARFSIERRVLAALNHPNICRFLDAGTLSDGSPYVVMELVDGEPLFDYCDQHRLGLMARLRLLRKVVGAVTHAHRQLIVHRDIKSSNVLVDRNGEPKLLDFGIAKSLAEHDPQQTSTSDRFFTPGNAAPEQLRGEPAGVGCDIYALGVLAYGLMCGRQPFDFDGLRASEVERLLLDVPPPLMSQQAASVDAALALARGEPSPAALSRTLTGELDAVVAACLRKSPGERYPSASQLDADLGAVLEQRPVSVRGGDRWYRLRKFVGRHRLAVALVSSLALTLVGGTAVVAVQALSLAQQRDRVTVERDRAQQLVDLLKESFISADPARVAGASVRLGNVLDAAMPRIEALRESQPEVYASLAVTMAEVEIGLGRDGTAAELADKAIKALAGSRGEGPLLRSLLLIQARALTTVGDHQNAQLALDEVRRRDVSEQPDWMVAHGRSLGRRAEFDEAVKMLRRSVERVRDRGPDGALAKASRSELAYALQMSGQPEAALEVVAQMLAWQQQVHPDSHPSVVAARTQRVDLLLAVGDPKRSLDEAIAVHAHVVAAYGADSPMAARVGASLARALTSTGQLDQAIEVYRQVVATWDATLGPTHAQTIRAKHNLAMRLEHVPSLVGEAMDLLAETVASAETRFGAAADSTHYMRHGLARLLLQEQRVDEALAVLTSSTALTGVDSLLPVNRRALQALLLVAAEGAGCSKPTRARPARECETALAILAMVEPEPAGSDGR